MSLSPGTPIRPVVGTVVLQHEFVPNQATISGLAGDSVTQGANVFKTAATTEAATVIAQVGQQGVAAAPTGDSGFHTFNVGYPGDKDISVKLTMPAENDVWDIFYKSDGQDTTDAGLGFIVRVQNRADPAIRFRVRSAIAGDGTVAGLTLDGGLTTNDVSVADETAEFTLLIEDRADKVSFYLNGTLVDAYTYTATDLAIIDGSGVLPDGSPTRVMVEVGFLAKDADCLIDDFTVTIR